MKYYTVQKTSISIYVVVIELFQEISVNVAA